MLTYVSDCIRTSWLMASYTCSPGPTFLSQDVFASIQQTPSFLRCGFSGHVKLDLSRWTDISLKSSLGKLWLLLVNFGQYYQSCSKIMETAKIGQQYSCHGSAVVLPAWMSQMNLSLVIICLLPLLTAGSIIGSMICWFSKYFQKKQPRTDLTIMVLNLKAFPLTGLV